MLVGGRYDIIRELGRGGFGKTYLAEDTYRRGGPKYVVKKLPPKSQNPAALAAVRERFDAETKLLYQIGTHEQIPRLYAHFEQNGEFYLVQELIDGNNLRQVLTLGAQLEEDKTVALLREILEIVGYIHAYGVIHQDLKPDNFIRRWKDKKLVLIDFGGVKSIRNLTLNPQGQPAFNPVIGTPGYMPKEQAEGSLQFCSDIYAIGMIGIQSLTGFLPTQLPRDPKTQELSWHDQAKVSPSLSAILDQMVRGQFDQRYQTVEEVLDALPGESVPIPKPAPILVEVAKPPQYRLMIPPQFESACHFAEGLAGVELDARLCYIDHTGKPIVQTPFSFNSLSLFRGAYQFSEQMARVDQDQKWGFINRTGEWAIAPKFDNAEDFHERLARVEVNNSYGFIDQTGAFVIPPQFESTTRIFSQGLAGVEIGHLYGYIDQTGKVVIPPQFDSGDDFVEGLARVTVKDQYGFIDKTGQMVIPPQFDVAHTFGEGMARVRIDGRYGFIDKTGKVVIAAQFDDNSNFSEGLSLVRNGDRYGYVDRKGKLVIDWLFDEAYSFSGGLAAVRVGPQWGFIDREGEFIIDLEYEDAGSLVDGLAAVKASGKWGYIGS